MKNCEILVSGKVRYNGKTYTPSEALAAGIDIKTVQLARNMRSAILAGTYKQKVRYYGKHQLQLK